MTVARLYRMHAAEGKEADLARALQDASRLVAAVPGCEGVDVLQEQGMPHIFIFLEKWTSVDAHKAAPEHLPAGALDDVMAALEGPPDGAYLDYLLTV